MCTNHSSARIATDGSSVERINMNCCHLQLEQSARPNRCSLSSNVNIFCLAANIIFVYQNKIVPHAASRKTRLSHEDRQHSSRLVLTVIGNHNSKHTGSPCHLLECSCCCYSYYVLQFICNQIISTSILL